MNRNLSSLDMFFRFVLGFSIFAVVLLSPVSPVWLALVATYPVFTGIMSWDPVYAAYLALVRSGSKGTRLDADALAATA